MSKKLELKKISKHDLEIIVKWRNNPKIMKYNRQFFLLNMKYQLKWFNELSKKDSAQRMFVFRYDGNIVGVGGLIHLDKKNRNAEVSIILGETKLHHRGIGTKALQLLINYGFQKLKLHRIEAEIFEYNKISVKLFEKLNFKCEAILKDSLWRNGRWWNVYIFSIIND